MIEQGYDELRCEYKRTPNDFHFRWLEQNNCCCSICHGTGARIEFEYVTRNYESAKKKGLICKNLQAHGHSFWICPTCMQNLNDKAKAIKERIKAEDEKKIPLICIRCKKDIPLTMRTFHEISYTHYSYCEDCLREGLKLLWKGETDANSH